jgi:hypothetical protein
LCTHFVSAICRLNCWDRFGAFVSAPQNPAHDDAAREASMPNA